MNSCISVKGYDLWYLTRLKVWIWFLIFVYKLICKNIQITTLYCVVADIKNEQILGGLWSSFYNFRKFFTNNSISFEYVSIMDNFRTVCLWWTAHILSRCDEFNGRVETFGPALWAPILFVYWIWFELFFKGVIHIVWQQLRRENFTVKPLRPSGTSLILPHKLHFHLDTSIKDTKGLI